MRSGKARNAKLRSNNRKKNKAINWLRWLDKLLTRKKIPIIPLECCAFTRGNKHIAGEIKKIGNATLFKSKACSGCFISAVDIDSYESDQNRDIPKESKCLLLDSGWMFVELEEEIREGYIVSIEKIGLHIP